MNNNIDDIDAKILECLQKDANMKTKEIAEFVYRSTEAVLHRIKVMEENRIILGYSANLDTSLLNRGFHAKLMIRLDTNSDKYHKEFLSAIKHFPEIIQVYTLSGYSDYLIDCATSDMAAFNQFHARLGSAGPPKKISSAFVIQKSKTFPSVDLSHYY